LDYSDQDLDAFLEGSQTSTDCLEREYSSKLFRLVLHEVHRALPGRNGRQVEAWIRAFLGCLDVPSTLIGLAKAEPVLAYILEKSFEASAQEVPEVPVTICTTLFAVLNNPPLNQDRRYQQRPAQAQSQLFTFHLTAVNPFAPQKPPAHFTGDLYRLWGFQIHRGLRGILDDPALDDETKKAYATSARAFYKLLREPDSLSSLPSVSEDELFETHLDVFKARAEACNAQLGWSDRTIESHGMRLMALYRRRPSHPHHHGRKGIEYLSEYVEGFDGAPPGSEEGERTAGSAPTVQTLISTESDEALEELYPDPDFYEVIHAGSSKSSTCPRLPRLSHKTVRRYILSNFGFWWDTTALQRKDLSELYVLVEGLIHESPRQVGLALFLLLLLYTGRPLRQLLHLQISRSGNLAQRTVSPDLDRALFIDLQKARLFYQHRYRASFQATPEQPWKPSLFWVSLPMPSPLGSLFHQYVEWLKDQGLAAVGEPFFYLARGGAAPTPLTLPILRRVLKSRQRRAGSSITVANIAQSFLPLFVHAFGLDEVASRIISGRALGRTFAPVNYTRMPWQALHQRYARCCLALHRYASPAMPLPGWWTSAVESSNGGAEAGAAAGSPLVMTEERLQALARILKLKF